MSTIPPVGQIGSFSASRAIAQRASAGASVSPEQIAAASGEQIKAGVQQQAAIKSLKTSQDTVQATVETLLGSLVDVSA